MDTKNGWEDCENAILEVHRQGPGEAPSAGAAIADLALDMARFELGDDEAGERLRRRAGGNTLDLHIELKGKTASCLGTRCMGRTTGCPANNPDCKNSPSRALAQISNALRQWTRDHTI
jgi:hypothetical protein